ncbi:hypothetical protein GCM10010381_58000 [Streptomyces xantholiticus]|nr:hypothetical protein GCM10010381_58000 [Streptomyces xantholiticus]
MPEYHVTWEIDLNATDPVDAARKALTIQRSAAAWATVFTVHGDTQTATVDLDPHCCDPSAAVFRTSSSRPDHPSLRPGTVRGRTGVHLSARPAARPPATARQCAGDARQFRAGHPPIGRHHRAAPPAQPARLGPAAGLPAPPGPALRRRHLHRSHGPQDRHHGLTEDQALTPLDLYLLRINAHLLGARRH